MSPESIEVNCQEKLNPGIIISGGFLGIFLGFERIFEDFFGICEDVFDIFCDLFFIFP